MWMLMIAVFGCETKDPFEDTGDEAINAAAGIPVSVSEEGSCWFSDVVCIETTDPYPDEWCAYEGGDYYYYEDCYSGWDGVCEIPSYTSYTYEYAATAYYYGMNGETACTDIGGTYTAG